MTKIIGVGKSGATPPSKPNTSPENHGLSGHNALNASINKAMLTFLVPPPIDRPFQSWRALIYTKKKPEKVYHGTCTYVTEVEPDSNIMKGELCDPDHVPAFFVQLTDKDQFIYIEGDVHDVLSCEIHNADKDTDKYLSRTTFYKELPDAEKVPKLILPGAGNIGPAPTATTIDPDEDVYVIDISFKVHPLKSDNQDRIDLVKSVAWSHGVSI